MSTTKQTTNPSEAFDILDALSKVDRDKLKQYRSAVNNPDISHIPGDNGMPMIGHMYWFLRDFRGWLDRQYQKNGSVFKFRMPMGTSIFLLGPEANKLMLVNEKKLFSNYYSWGEIFIGTFNNAVLGKDFAPHKKTRKSLQPAFKREAIEGHIELMNPSIKQGLEQWPTDKAFRFLPRVKKLLLDTGAKVFLGIDLGSEADKINQAFIAILGSMDLPIRSDLPFMPWAKAMKGRKVLEAFAMENIPKRRGVEGRDTFTHFCNLTNEEGDLLTDQEVQDQILFLLFAAHDTTTSALSGILYCLGANPEWQEEVREEIMSLGVEAPVFDDTNNIPKTSLTIQESLRLYSPITLLPRFALEEFDFEGHRIPQGARLMACTSFTHRMPEFWSEPDKFDPYRFSEERAEDKGHLFQYVPFGGGAHKCLGLHFAQVQAKIFLFHLLTNYRVELKNKGDYKYTNIPMALPKDGLPIILRKL